MKSLNLVVVGHFIVFHQWIVLGARDFIFVMLRIFFVELLYVIFHILLASLPLKESAEAYSLKVV